MQQNYQLLQGHRLLSSWLIAVVIAGTYVNIMRNNMCFEVSNQILLLKEESLTVYALKMMMMMMIMVVVVVVVVAAMMTRISITVVP